MPVVALFVIVAAAVAVAILYPEFRIIAYGVIALFAGLVAVYFATVDDDIGAERQFDLEAVALADIGIEDERGFSRVSGRVTNLSEDARLRSFRLDLKLFDCPAETEDLDGCAVIAEDEDLVRVDVPPGQTRSFESIHGFSDRPDILGVPRWDLRVIAAEATR